MQFKISNASVSYGADTVLKNINFEISGNDKIAVVGRNGCGKTTLLNVISGETEIDRDDSLNQSSIIKAGVSTIGCLKQTAFDDDSLTLLQVVRNIYKPLIDMQNRIDKLSNLLEDSHDEILIHEYSELQEQFNKLGGYYFEKEYETVIKKFGFTQEDKNRSVSEFSGGQRTKIAFIKLLLSKPDILLLDEPTNHLDIESIEWLENYIINYSKAVIIVSHDRKFLDKTVTKVYEIENSKIALYSGNYTEFTIQKKLLREGQMNEYLARQKEIERLQTIVDKFKYKPTKASMADRKSVV